MAGLSAEHPDQVITVLSWRRGRKALSACSLIRHLTEVRRNGHKTQIDRLSRGLRRWWFTRGAATSHRFDCG